MAKILIAEDDVSLGITLQVTLENEKHTVERVEDGLEACDRLKLYTYQLVILDIELPGMSGFDVCKEYRDSRGNTPILMLTGKSDISDKETGFNAGADDYLTKPFDTRELMVRVAALLRRSQKYLGNVLECRGLKLDINSRIATKHDKDLELTAKEFELLEFLMKRKGQFFNVDKLLNEVWTAESDSSELAARQLIRRLRKKIDSEDERPYIVTSKGLGYKFDE